MTTYGHFVNLYTLIDTWHIVYSCLLLKLEAYCSSSAVTFMFPSLFETIYLEFTSFSGGEECLDWCGPAAGGPALSDEVI